MMTMKFIIALVDTAELCSGLWLIFAGSLVNSATRLEKLFLE